MHNSFSLGLLHGALYGITPMTPWFIGFQRYVLDGQNKGLLTFAGLFLGQLFVLLIAFFGGTEVLWLWYYLEPVLIIFGLIGTINAFGLCWQTQKAFPKPLVNRKEGLLYMGTGAFFAICNPCGARIGVLLVGEFPENTALYLCGFILVYTLVVLAMLYMLCLSPLGQKAFGRWSIANMLENQEPNNMFSKMRIRNVQILGVATCMAFILQLVEGSWAPYGAFYFDLLLGGTPAKSITPMKDFHWIESEEDEEIEDGEDKEPGKVLKLQSASEMNHIMENDAELEIEEEGPWHTVWKYNSLNERLEREAIPDEQKANELEDYERKGPNTYVAKRYVKWYESSQLRLRFTPAVGGEEKTEMNVHWLKELTRIRAEMDDIFIAQAAANYNLPRAYLPFTPTYDLDYDWDPVAIAKDEEMTEDDVLTLLSLKEEGEPTAASDFFDETYDMMHRGNGQIDFGAVKLQDLPKEVHFPWDYPLVRAPNVRDIKPGIQEDEEKAVKAKNDVQNKNVWFLDPVAVNMRFLANDPAPANDPRWTSEPITKGEPTPGDVPELRVPNTTRRWWLGTDFTVEADAQAIFQTPREIISAKVIAGGPKRP